MKKHYIVVLLLSAFLSNAQNPLLQENFNYTVGSPLATGTAVDATTGWSAHSGTTNPILVTSPGLTFTNYYGTGVGGYAAVNNTGIDCNKVFTAQSSNAVYTSFLVNASVAISGYFFHIGATAVGTEHRGRVFCQPIAGNTTQFQLGLSFNAAAAQTVATTPFNYGQTYLVVLKYNIITGTINDTVSLYVFDSNSNIDTEPATALIGPLVATANTATPPVFAADVNPGSIALRQFDAAQRVSVDAIRVSTVWDLNSTLSTSQNSLSTAKFYPNPVQNGILNIQSNNVAINTIEICDLLGKIVYSSNKFSESINVSYLNNGVYVLNLKGDDGAVRVEKFVIAKN